MSALKLTKPVYFGKFVVTNSVFHVTPLSFAIVNHKPILPGHVLVSPRRIVPRFTDLTTEEVTDLYLTVQRVAKMVERVFNATAANIAMQDGADAGQSVPHVHAHIIPRKKADLDHVGGNDRIYEMLDGPEGDVGGHLQEQQSRRERKSGIKVDADEDRKVRSEEEMIREAEWLAEEMAKDVDKHD